MEVRIRHLDEASNENRPFAKAKNETEVSELIDFIGRCGGVYIAESGDTFEYHSLRIVMDDSDAYVEIIVGEEIAQ